MPGVGVLGVTITVAAMPAEEHSSARAPTIGLAINFFMLFSRFLC